MKSLLVVQNFKIAFNSVGATISTLWNMGSLEKGCFRLNELSSHLLEHLLENLF